MLHLVGILFPHINDDARSRSHKIFMFFNLKLRILNRIKIPGKDFYKNWRVNTEEDGGLFVLTETNVWSWNWLRNFPGSMVIRNISFFWYLYFFSALTADEV